jgi:putative addiction module component (TIGR02574 family)
MATPEEILKEAISLRPSEQARLVDHLIFFLDKPDSELDKLWSEEAESRLDAYNSGKLKAVSLDEVLSKYK